MPAESKHYWTRAEVLALPDDGSRYEMVDGELLVAPTPRLAHQVVAQALFRLIDPYVIEHRLGVCFCVPGDLTLGSEQVVQPDLYVLPVGIDLRTDTWADVGVPVLTVEVLSPSTARNDRVIKRHAYQRAGVATYGIVDVDSQLVEVWTPEAVSPVIVTEELVWRPDAAVEALRISLQHLFGVSG